MFRKVILLILCLLIAASPALGEADYRITKYSMHVDVLPDGNADVKETLIYEFDGEYNGILSLFDADGLDGINDLRLSIDGELLSRVPEMNYTHNTYTLTHDRSLIEVRAYSPGKDDARVVQYEYRMDGLADRYQDTGMILRTLIGKNNAVSLQDAVVRVSFKEEAALQAFVHGGMNAEDTTVGEDYVEFGPKTIHSDSYAEMRILFPAELIPDAELIPEPMLSSALAEETRLTQEAENRARMIQTGKYVFSAAYTLIFLLVWLLLAKKYGLKNRLHETPDFRRLTAYPAAFATAAVEDEPDTDAVSATLTELVQKGRISMQSVDNDLHFTILNRSSEGLWPHQTRLIDWLFGQGDEMSLSSLHAGGDYERAQAFERGYAAYCAQVSLDMSEQKIKYKNEGLKIAVNALLILTGIIGTGFILIADTPDVFLGCAVLLMLFFLIYLMSRVRTLTDQGERIRMDAAALLSSGVDRQNLTDLLPYCTALGMTEPLIEAYRAESTLCSAEEAPFNGLAWYLSLHMLTDSMRASHHHNASVPDPSASSSSATSGGGSNGGGGGHGAW